MVKMLTARQSCCNAAACVAFTELDILRSDTMLAQQVSLTHTDEATQILKLFLIVEGVTVCILKTRSEAEQNESLLREFAMV